jgi:hypothetical protein
MTDGVKQKLHALWRSIEIWGKSPETIKGKTTTHQAPIIKME